MNPDTLVGGGVATKPARERSVALERPQVETVDFLGVPLRTCSFDAAADEVARAVLAGGRSRPGIVSHVNVANFHHLARHPDLRERMIEGCTMFMDGIAMKIGAGILGLGQLPDLNGTDLFPLVMDRLQAGGASVFCLGSRPEVVRRAAAEIRRRWPAVRVAGWHHGYFDSDEAVVETVRASGADLLLIGRGFGPQEAFALRHARAMRVRAVWTVGGLFDFVSGAVPRAPLWMRKLRLEWLFRLLREPRKKFYRNFVSFPWFLLHVLRLRCSRAYRRRTS
jgi:N-acetylglucosaminyldiphosphoundecaprenol N-acetyl-beta-D-mannosaminyltransferase